MFGRKRPEDKEKLSREELIIIGMKRKSSILIVRLFVIIISIIGFFIMNHLFYKADSMTMGSFIEREFPFREAQSETIFLLRHFHGVVLLQSKILIYSIIFVGVIGLTFANLIIELIGDPQKIIMISMWDRIKQLEQRLEELSPQQGQADNVDTEEGKLINSD